MTLGAARSCSRVIPRPARRSPGDRGSPPRPESSSRQPDVLPFPSSRNFSRPKYPAPTVVKVGRIPPIPATATSHAATSAKTSSMPRRHHKLRPALRRGGYGWSHQGHGLHVQLLGQGGAHLVGVQRGFGHTHATHEWYYLVAPEDPPWQGIRQGAWRRPRPAPIPSNTIARVQVRVSSASQAIPAEDSVDRCSPVDETTRETVLQGYLQCREAPYGFGNLEPDQLANPALSDQLGTLGREKSMRPATSAWVRSCS